MEFLNQILALGPTVLDLGDLLPAVDRSGI